MSPAHDQDESTDQNAVRGGPDQATIGGTTKSPPAQVGGEDGVPLKGDIAVAPGTQIGPYRILQRIGEGGFGSVYVAKQTEPIVRTVAMKIIKMGMDTRQVIARFEAERQALAIMDHPNIAKVLDAGATREGRPYFVMELVKGVPLTEYCDHHALSMKERLDLFTTVCQAIQHAHQKGIIHRDIKPSNVLVTLQDGKPTPKVIDFGIAKATNHRLTEKTLFTEVGLFVGTPEYMSPEQAELTGLDIDTRSDIYSLGVLLYELLTGTTPFDRERLRSAGYVEIQRIIREEDPPRPSTKLSHLTPAAVVAEEGQRPAEPPAASIADVARARRTDPASLIRSIRGELDWIIMKALEKDRSRRYETAKDLAEDIQRNLADEPVTAGPPGAGYRFAKFARRHRALLGSAAAIAAALLIGLTLAIVGFVNASRERDQKEEARAAAEAARDEAEAVTTFLSDMLAAVNPAEDGKDVRVLEVLDQASKKIGAEFSDQPTVEGRLRHTMGVAYRTLGALDAAERHLLVATEIRRRVLGDDDVDTLDSMNNLGAIYAYLGRYEEAADLYTRALEVQQSVLGKDHPDTLDSMTSLGVVYLFQHRYDDAEPHLREALEVAQKTLGDDDNATLTALNNLAGMYTQQGRLEEAEPLFRKAFDARRRTLGNDHPETLLSMENLASLLGRLRRDAESEAMFREAITLARRKVGDKHVTTARFLNDFGGFLRERDRCQEAVALYAEALRFFESEYPPRFYYTGFVLVGHGSCLTQLGRFEEAESALTHAYEIIDEAGEQFSERKTTAIEALVALYERWDKPKPASAWRARLPTRP